jgi:hypothetical protein
MEDNLVWHDLRSLEIEGQGWRDTLSPYDRLPSRAQQQVRPAVWDLSRHAAGLCARFVADAPRIAARWTLTGEALSMPHMPATGVSGLDLYARTDGGAWRWLAVGVPAAFPTCQAVLSNGMPPRLARRAAGGRSSSTAPPSPRAAAPRGRAWRTPPSSDAASSAR